MKKIIILVSILLVIVGVSYLLNRFGSSLPAVKEEGAASPSSQGPASPAAITQEKTATGAADLQKVTVNMSSLRFRPDSLKVKAGQKFFLTLTSDGSHTYTVDKLGVNLVLKSGESKTYEMTVDEKGTYPVYCATAGHKVAGMVGKLVVE